MKKRILVFAAVLMTVCGIEAFGWAGIGVEGGLPLPLGGGLPGSNVMLTFKIDRSPLFGVGVGFNGDGTANIGLIADWWAIQEHIAGPLQFFFGPGIYAAYITHVPPEVALGLRLPVGFQVFPVKWFEIFIEVAPGAGVVFHDGTAGFGWNISAAAGIRFWFN